MPSALNPTCPLCGLRYTDRSVLDLHIREDHRQRGSRPEPAQRDSGDAGASRPRVGGQTRPLGAVCGPPAATNDVVTTTTATRRRPRSCSGWAMTVLPRAVRTARHVNEELLLASAAIARSARAPQALPREDAPAGMMPARLPPPNPLTASPDSMAAGRPDRPGGQQDGPETGRAGQNPADRSLQDHDQYRDAHDLHEPAGP